MLVEGYGLTEGTCASACNPVDGVRKLGTVGPALPGQRIAILGPDGTPVSTGETGQIAISGPTVMKGYLGRPADTALVRTGEWLLTGDIGRLDEDGYLQVVDRVKDMIIRGGENLYPKEIEAVLAEAEGVLEVAVVGQRHKVLGEVPVAYVVPFPGAKPTESALLDHCRTRLTRVKLPVTITLLSALPKNAVGKIDKPALRRGLG